MKNVAIISVGDFGSTGRIATGLHKYLLKQGYCSYFCYARQQNDPLENSWKFVSDSERRIHAFLCRVFGGEGTYSKISTKKLVNRLKQKGIDTVFGVLLHGYYLNLKTFYNYLADENIAFVNIMVDESDYLGKCTYRQGCDNYINGCGHCPQKRKYPNSLFFDKSKVLFSLKGKLYSKLNRKCFVGPQIIIENALTSPIMTNIPTKVIDESIDTSFYRPRNTTSLKNELGIDKKKFVCVCVAPYDGTVGFRKGVEYYIDLAKEFENNSAYVFVHVGYLAKDKSNLPSNYIAKGFISDQDILVEYFSLGDVFVFPSLADSMPSACLCALSCGTPILCFDTYGMSYMAPSGIGTFVEPKSTAAMKKALLLMEKKDQTMIDLCRNYAQNRYDNQTYYRKLEETAIEL